MKLTRVEALDKRVELFEKTAQTTVQSTIKTMAGQLKNIFYGLNWSYQKTTQENPEFLKERSFQAIRTAIPHLVDNAVNLEKVVSEGGADISYFVRNMNAYLGGVLFFTSSGNAGTGYDSRTKVKPMGGSSISDLTVAAGRILSKLNQFVPNNGGTLNKTNV